MSQATPDGAPNVRQLLAFYLEAGVDCALNDEPVNRLADPDAAPPERPAAPPQPTQQMRAMPAARPLAPAEAPPTADAAIASAREAGGPPPPPAARRSAVADQSPAGGWVQPAVLIHLLWPAYSKNCERLLQTPGALGS
jgi:hypothetical protein